MTTKNLTYTSVLIAIGLLLPIIFHYLIPELGSYFSPMHYFTYLAAGFFDPNVGAIVGLITSLLSTGVTSMPPFPIFIYIAFEAIFYGLLFGFLFYQKRINSYVSLISAMIIGRIIYILLVILYSMKHLVYFTY